VSLAVAGEPERWRDVASAGRPRRVDVVAKYSLGVDAYEKLWSPVILPGAVALLPWLKVGDGSVVVDVGGGTGALLGAIHAVSPTALVVTLDASPEMLRVAYVARGASAVEADAVVLPVAAETVDAVVLAYVLFHVADPQATLAEAARVLRPGGRVGVVTWASERTERAQLVWDEVLADANVPPLRPGRVDRGLDSAEGIDAMLRAAGFVPQRVWPHRLRHQWDAKSFWALATGSGTNRLRLSRIDTASREVVLARFHKRLSELGPDDYRWEGEVICAVAAKPAAGST
jgi:SAM-dependent methyltransferase